MMTVDLSEAWGVYLSAVRLHAHQLLAWAYKDIRPSLNCDMDEPSITGLLGGAMAVRLNSSDIPQEFDLYTVGDQTPVSPTGELGNDRLRLDLCIVRAGVRPRLKYIFEAKRLRTNGFPIGKYVGQDGIGEFIECRYGAGNPEAVMIGLFQNRDATYWQSELRRAFNEDYANLFRLATLEKLTPVHIIDSFPDELQSRHRRRDASEIRLFHIFLDCSTEAAQEQALP